MKKWVIIAGILIFGISTATSDSIERTIFFEDKLKEINEFNKERFVQDEIIVKFKGNEKSFIIKVPQNSVEERVKEYLKKVNVEYAEPNYLAYTQLIPDDSYYKYQWHLDNSEYGGIQMEKAWDISTGDNSVVVAVLDTGIAYENYRQGRTQYCQASDLSRTCFVQGYDFVNKDSHPNDDNGHGTHIAGTIAQSTNNALGTAGIAFDTCLMPVKVLDSQGSGTYANIAEGIRYATDNGAKIISLSLGGSSDSQTLRDAVKYAYEKGATLIAVCGNDKKSSCLYPAFYDEVISVGATQYDETKAPYSNYGSSLSLVAPGGNLNLDQNKDRYPDGVLQQTFKDSRNLCNFAYYFFQGTSMATPHVSGVAALLIANGNAITPDEIKIALQTTAKDLGEEGRDDIYGWGLVDAYSALNWKAGPECEEGQTKLCGESDVSECKYGTQTCTAEKVWGECIDAIYPTEEICDGLDNNCDGLIDEDLGQTTCGVGACKVTINNCVNGEPQVCIPNEPTEEICDGLDNNCDGLIDEDGVCGNVKCWNAEYQYLYRNNGQASKFCKCVSGVYGFSNYASRILIMTSAYQYIDTKNNENWETTSRVFNLPVYQVRCPDGKTYPTNQDYYYSK